MEPIRERERESWGLESSGIVGGGGGSAWFYMLFEAPREEREINSPALFFFWSVREKDERKDEVCLRPRTIYSLFLFLGSFRLKLEKKGNLIFQILGPSKI